MTRWDGSRWHTVTQLPSTVNGLAIDQWTAGALAQHQDPRGFQVIDRVRANSTRTTVLTLTATSAAVSGIALNPSTRIYGSPMANAYEWLVPNPGGNPFVGNAAFRLNMTASSRSMPGAMAIGTGPEDRQMLGFRLRVAGIALVQPFPASARNTLSLPIPADPTLAGLSLFAQAVHVDGTRLASSAGLRWTLH